MISSFRDLEIYQLSYSLMLKVHQEINKLPVYERQDLVSQMRRASKSIVANIAEGYAKRIHQNDFKRHLDMALGSANEMEAHIEMCRDLKYLDESVCNEMLKNYSFLGGKIVNLRIHWRNKEL